ncbi:MAG: hypothetical protein CME64_13790 [Halobacteriovoraceae bacterium]|nr:hypothetical protein [Halobacteriovoraceae bacterium]|tara:strand:- start:34242 stop:35054 length:813 start_codon:yes stop_codon:yes gene_type:complete
MNDKSSVHFQELTENEKTSKLSQFIRNGGELVVWEKGSKERLKLKAYELKELNLYCSKGSSSIEAKEVLYSFELNGLSFFGTAELGEIDKTNILLNCEKKLFKSERRSNFRLLTFPHHRVFIKFPLEQEEAQEGNVIGMKLGMSETGLFKKFLSLVEEGDQEDSMVGNSFRVLDLSVTGASFRVGGLESKFFEQTTKFSDLELVFNRKKVNIPGAEVVYNVEMISDSNSGHIYKVGVKFSGIDVNLDQELGALINSVLRDFETEFEDFVE